MPALSMREGNRGRFIPNFVEGDVGSGGAGTTGQRPIRWRRATAAHSPALCAPYASSPDPASTQLALHLGDLSGNDETEARPPLTRVFELSTCRNCSKVRSHSSTGTQGPVDEIRVVRELFGGENSNTH
jgi:hypothetical protein